MYSGKPPPRSGGGGYTPASTAPTLQTRNTPRSRPHPGLFATAPVYSTAPHDALDKENLGYEYRLAEAQFKERFGCLKRVYEGRLDHLSAQVSGFVQRMSGDDVVSAMRGDASLAPFVGSHVAELAGAELRGERESVISTLAGELAGHEAANRTLTRELDALRHAHATAAAKASALEGETLRADKYDTAAASLREELHAVSRERDAVERDLGSRLDEVSRVAADAARWCCYGVAVTVARRAPTLTPPPYPGP